MLVICPKCAASYNVPDEKIPEGGARTKCATCATSFRIEKVPQDLVASNDDPFGTPQEFRGDDIADLFGSSDDLQSNPEGQQDLTPTMVFDPTGRSEKRLAQGAPQATPGKRPVEDYPDFDWPDPAESTTPGVVAAGPAADTSGSDPFSASLFQPALDESQGRYILGQKPSRTSRSGVNVRRSVSRQRRTITFYVLMALIAGGGGYVAVNIGTYAALDWTELYYLSVEALGLPSPRPVAKPMVFGAVVNKVYEETTLAGEKLLVVEGQVQNQCETVQEKLSVTVTFSDADGAEVTSHTVYAGNVLSSIQLKTLPIDQVMALHARPLGAALINAAVQPQSSLPFQLVFYPVPDVRTKIAVLARSAQSPAIPGMPSASPHEPQLAAQPVSHETDSGHAEPTSPVDSPSTVPSTEAVTTP